MKGVVDVRGYQTKKDIIYETLKKEIYEGEYEFEEKLVISKIAKRFDSSESPVREAMNKLNSEDLIEFKPHVGAVVSTLSSEDIKDIFELRIELEGFATRLATNNLEEKDFEEIRHIVKESYSAIEKQDYDLFEKLNIDFHMKIYSKCQNKLLVKTIQDLWKNTNRYPSLFKKNDEHNKLSVKEHEEIYLALLEGDSVSAERNMLKHKARAGKEILRLTEQEFYKDLDSVSLSETQKITNI